MSRPEKRGLGQDTGAIGKPTSPRQSMHEQDTDRWVANLTGIPSLEDWHKLHFTEAGAQKKHRLIIQLQSVAEHKDLPGDLDSAVCYWQLALAAGLGIQLGNVEEGEYTYDLGAMLVAKNYRNTHGNADADFLKRVKRIAQYRSNAPLSDHAAFGDALIPDIEAFVARHPVDSPTISAENPTDLMDADSIKRAITAGLQAVYYNDKDQLVQKAISIMKTWNNEELGRILESWSNQQAPEGELAGFAIAYLYHFGIAERINHTPLPTITVENIERVREDVIDRTSRIRRAQELFNRYGAWERDGWVYARSHGYA